MNPFNIYSVVFIFVCIIYYFGWSNQFPDLEFHIILFLFITIVIMTIMGIISNKFFSYKFYRVKDTIGVKKNILILLIMTIIQVVLQPKIPLYMILFHSIDNHGIYGTPILLPIITTFSSFLGIFIFHLILSENKRKKKYILLFILSFIPPFLFYYRGTVTITILSCIIMFLFYIREYIKIKSIFKVLLLLFISIYLFGLIGNLRLPKDQNILLLGNASETFINSGIPSEFFWVYMYLASPLANLQLNMTNIIQSYNISSFYISEIIPSLLSQHIFTFLGEDRLQIDRTISAFTVGTIYARAYKYLGWYGITFLFMNLLTYINVFLAILKKCKNFYLTGLCILSTASLLSVFSNMLVETSIVLPLLFCVFFYLLNKIKF